MVKRKPELRTEMRVVLGNLDERWLKAASREACVNLSKLLVEDLGSDVRHVLAWLSFFPGEVDLSGFISEHLDEYEMYLPRTLEDRSMRFVSIGTEWQNELQPGGFGIPEPQDTTGSLYDIENAAETVILVPGMAFDREGNRLGRGKGYYDRFLSQSAMSRCIKVGIGWDLQILPTVYADGHDILMDWVCTEEQIIKAAASIEDD